MPTAPFARRYHRALRWALAGYTAILGFVLGWPTPTVPVVQTLEVMHGEVRDLGVSDWANFLPMEFAANIALFVPFGLLLALVLSRGRWWVAMLGGFAFSLVAEIVQGTLYVGRSGSVSDVVANTAGTIIGVLVAVLVGRLVSRHESQPAPDPDPKEITRTGRSRG